MLGNSLKVNEVRRHRHVPQQILRNISYKNNNLINLRPRENPSGLGNQTRIPKVMPSASQIMESAGKHEHLPDHQRPPSGIDTALKTDDHLPDMSDRIHKPIYYQVPASRNDQALRTTHHQ